MSDNKKQRVGWRSLLAGFVLVSVIVVGYIYRNEEWTGFSKTEVITTTIEEDKQGQTLKTTISKQPHLGKTFWDWLDLLIVPVLLLFWAYKFQQIDKEREKNRTIEQDKLEKDIAKVNLAEEGIQNYLKSMAQILIDKELRKELFTDDKDNEYHDNPVRDVTRTLTITILRRLEEDRPRQERIIHFLRDAELYGFIFKNANLSKINLSGVNLRQANLEGADLREANLEGAKLEEADLREANLEGANLEEAEMLHAELEKADLKKSKMSYASLEKANLEGVNLWGAEMFYANLDGTILIDTKNLTHEQIKSTLFWKKAIYQGEWNEEKKTWVAIEPDNAKFIEDLKKDKSSDPRNSRFKIL